MHIHLLKHGSSNHGAPRSRSAEGNFQTAFSRLRNCEPLTSADQEIVNHVSRFCGRFVGGYLQNQATLAKAEVDGKLDDITKLYTEAAFKARVAAILDPLAGGGSHHSLLIARLDDYADLCEKFGAADVEEEFLAPAAATLEKHLPYGAFAGRVGVEGLAAFMPDTDLITASLFSKQAISEIANVRLPRSVEGFSHLGMSVALEPIQPVDNLEAKLAAIAEQLESAYSQGHDVLSDPFHTEVGLRPAA